MRVAMLGTRGVPASFGGVERHVEELGTRLAERGHEVVVFCRTNYVSDRRPEYRGMRLRHLPAVGTKHLDAVTHTALATVRALRGFDVVHYHAVGPGLLSPLPAYLSRARVVQTIHGLDAERAKWGAGAQAVLRGAERLSARVPDAVITVSRTLAEHYRTRHGRETYYIPNGVVERAQRPASEISRRFALKPGSYVLFVGRLVPEKGADLLLRAFRRLDLPLRLVIAGGTSFSDDYVDRLKELAACDDRVLFTGYVYGEVLDELFANAAVLVSPSSLEAGPPLTVLEALSCPTPVVCSDIPTQMEAVPADAAGGRLFRSGDEVSLLAALHRALADPAGERRGAARLRQEVIAAYSWDSCALLVELVYRHALTGRRRASTTSE